VFVTRIQQLLVANGSRCATWSVNDNGDELKGDFPKAFGDGALDR
jgi:hypothetical protein